MLFRLVHHRLRGLIDSVVRTVPVNHYSIDPAADHVRNLPLDLGRVTGTVSHIHVARSSEPQHQVRKDLGRRPRIEQRVHIELADIVCAQVAVRLVHKTVCGAGVVTR